MLANIAGLQWKYNFLHFTDKKSNEEAEKLFLWFLTKKEYQELFNQINEYPDIEKGNQFNIIIN